MKVEITKGWDGDAIADLGEHNRKGAFDAVKKWAKAHAGYDDFMDAAWGFCHCQDGHYIVDFGSHTYFGRYMP